MNIEIAYIRLHHLGTMLRMGQTAALNLESESERLQYADAVLSVLPVLEKYGVIVEKPAHSGVHPQN